MNRLNQRGFSPIIILLILALGLVGGLYLVQHQTALKPHAQELPTHNVSGNVYFDADQNGTKADSENYFDSGSLIVLIYPGSSCSGKGATFIGTGGPTGSYNYSFNDGTYTVCLNTDSLPSGYKLTTPASKTVTVAGADITDINFGIYSDTPPPSTTVCKFACAKGTTCVNGQCVPIGIPTEPLIPISSPSPSIPQEPLVPPSVPSATSDYFIKNWVENHFDNDSGLISLTGGVPTPGIQTTVGSPSLKMVTITFKVRAAGQGAITFDPTTTAIYRNSDNANILGLNHILKFNSTDATPGVSPIPNPSATTAPCPDNALCAQPVCTQQVTSATDPDTGECRQFSTPCDVPQGWKTADSCPANPPVLCPLLGNLISGLCNSLPTTSNNSPAPSTATSVNSGDSNFTIQDFSIMMSNYNRTKGFPAKIDLNTDGKINSFDFSQLRNQLVKENIIHN